MAREIIPGTSQLLETCGRSSAASGTEGTLELWDKTQRICKLYWTARGVAKSTNSRFKRSTKHTELKLGLGIPTVGL